MKAQKTNAARILDAAKVPYRLVAYDVDESDLSGAHVAEQLGLDAARIFKTLVLRGDRGGYFVCLAPANAELDLKKAARASGNKSCELIAVKDLLAVTGYMRGGCSPVGMKKRFPAYIHRTARELDTVYVSAGQRGLQFHMKPGDLIREIRAEIADLVTD